MTQPAPSGFAAIQAAFAANGATMKSPKIQTGTGTLARFKRPRPIVTLYLRDNGYGPGTCFHDKPPSNWTCMSAAEARKLGERLLKAAARAERGR